MSTAIAVVCSLAAAFFFAVGSLLQQGEARSSGERLLHLRLLLSLLRQPRWIAGIALSAGSFAVMGVALAFGPLTLVQPLAATDSMFALPLIARRNRRRLTGRDVAAMLTVTVGIAVFLVVSPPYADQNVPGLATWIPVFAAVAVVVGGSALAALRIRGQARVLALAAAAGCSFGLLDALLKSSVDILGAKGFTAVLSAWEPYSLLAAAVLGGLFGQSAFAAGPLSLSLPVIDTVEPAAAVTIGATVFGEQLAASPALLAIQLAGGAVAVAGIAALTRSSVVETETTLSPRADAGGQAPVASGPDVARPGDSLPDRADGPDRLRRNRPGAG